MSKFILSGVAVALTVFIFFAYQLKAERANYSGQSQQNWGPVMVPEHKPVPRPERKITDLPQTYQEALALSRKTGMPMVLYFTALSGCEPCRAMERTTLKDHRVKAVLRPYIFYKIDVNGIERDVAQAWHVRSVPMYIVTDFTQRIHKIGQGFRGADAFVEWLNSPAQMSCNLYIIPERQVLVTRHPIRNTLRATGRVIVGTGAVVGRVVGRVIVRTERTVVRAGAISRITWGIRAHRCYEPIYRKRVFSREHYCSAI